MIAQVSAAEILAAARQSFGLPAGDLDEAFVAAALRRAASALCPCSQSTLAAAVHDALRFSRQGSSAIENLLQDCLEGLTVAGDLLEINRVTLDDPNIPGTWLFAGPPSFVRRASGTLVVFGIATGGLLPLPQRLSSQLRYNGCFRMLPSDGDDVIAAELRDLGFIEQRERSWLRAPPLRTASAFRNAVLTALDASPNRAPVAGLEILIPLAGGYGRWTIPEDQTGVFVARRPQAYGAPLWCAVRLGNGVCTNLLDLPPADDPYPDWRGCDYGWQLRFALDACAGQPCRYQRRLCDPDIELRFNFPLPLWTTRRLELAGRRQPRQHALLTYLLPAHEAEADEEFLQQMLWLQPESL
jgi:hypothetical protein